MTALSIRHMRFTMQMNEHAQARRDAAEYARRPANCDQSHYWWIERKARRGWIFVRDFIGTKKEIADAWRKHFRGRQPRYRLVHKLTYSS